MRGGSIEVHKPYQKGWKFELRNISQTRTHIKFRLGIPNICILDWPQTIRIQLNI